MKGSKLKVIRSVEEFFAVEYDYLIVGGGTAGLAVAARLSEDPSVSVGVVEAGSAHLDDPAIITPAAFATVIENPDYDWGLKTVPQNGTHGIIHSVPRGKVLGGSSAINYMQYVRGQRDEYRDWNRLTGYKNWGWDDLNPYFIKHEGFHGPSSSDEDPSYHDDSQLFYQCEKDLYHGASGPVRTSFPTWGALVERDWHRSAKNLDIGFQVPSDAWSGHNVGGYSNLSTIDRINGSGTRSYATTAYLLPCADRSNLSVLVEAQVLQIMFGRTETRVRASGIRVAKAGKEYTAAVKREIILCAGVVHSPQLLEVSGIGQRQRLESLGIECIVENDQVGEGLEDHVCTSVTYEINSDVFTNDWMGKKEVATKAEEDYKDGKGGILANPVGNTAFLPLSRIASEKELLAVRDTLQEQASLSSNVIRAQRELLAARISDPNAASFQMSMLPGGVDPSKQHAQKEVFMSGVNAISVMVVTTHPFSRGSVHISAKGVDTMPDIDPGYLGHPADATILAIGLRVADDILNSSPLKEQLTRRIFPSPDVDLTDLEAVKKYVHRHAITSYHPIGTLALGQVVDERLRVKGVDGLRVVDASIFPLHLSGNIVATVYAVAEKAADMIKEDAGR